MSAPAGNHAESNNDPFDFIHGHLITSPQFDASADVVEQLEAVSKDGTKVPHFVVRRRGIGYDGTNPTLLTAYGGFQISETRDYSASSASFGWSVAACLSWRISVGGGEFGPAWHEAGLKTHRQRIYDDFAAVGQDLVTRRILRQDAWASWAVRTAAC